MQLLTEGRVTTGIAPAVIPRIWVCAHSIDPEKIEKDKTEE